MILDEYIREGLANNLRLWQESLDISRVRESLNQARSLFCPRLAFNPTYSLAAGGDDWSFQWANCSIRRIRHSIR